MHAHETTLSELTERRRRQDRDFQALCSALSALDPELHFRLSEARSAELRAAWEPAFLRRKAGVAEVHALRA